MKLNSGQMRGIYQVGNVDPWDVIDPLSQNTSLAILPIPDSYTDFDLRQTD